MFILDSYRPLDDLQQKAGKFITWHQIRNAFCLIIKVIAVKMVYCFLLSELVGTCSLDVEQKRPKIGTMGNPTCHFCTLRSTQVVDITEKQLKLSTFPFSN